MYKPSAILLIAVWIIFLAGISVQASQSNDHNTFSSVEFNSVLETITEAVNTIPLDGGVSFLLRYNQIVMINITFAPYTYDQVATIASGAKWLSAATIMTLVEANLLELDDQLSTYFPHIPKEKATISIRMLLSHTAGFIGQQPCLYQATSTLQICVDQILATPLRNNAGTDFFYGGTSFQVAGRIAEIVTNQSWQEIFQERIAKPLGMNHTTYGTSTNPNLARGVTSSVTDYNQFLQMLLANGIHQGVRILKENSIQAMEQDQTNNLSVTFSFHRDNRRYGLGVWRDQTNNEGIATQLSSQGVYGFSPWIDRQRGIIGIFLVENTWQNVYDLILELQQTIRDIVDTKTLSPASVVSGFLGLGAFSSIMLIPIIRKNGPS